MGPDALSAAEVVRLLDLRPHPEGGHFRETFRDPRAARADAPPRPRSTTSSAPARPRDGTGSTRPRSGISTPARRSSSRSRRTDTMPRRTGSGRTWPAASARRSWFRRMPGRRPPALAPGRSSAARSRRASRSPASRWRRPAGSRRRAAWGRLHDRLQPRPAARDAADQRLAVARVPARPGLDPALRQGLFEACQCGDAADPGRLAQRRSHRSTWCASSTPRRSARASG